jgi:DNA processing protein
MALRAVEGLGDLTLCRLARALGSPEAVFAATIDELVTNGGLTAPQAQAVLRGPNQEVRRDIERELKALERLRLSVVTCLDANYPRRLAAIPDPPLLLYVGGSLAQADNHAIAIVGSRRVTAGGRLVTEELSCKLAAAGFTIVSGLARGVDAAAHRGALAGEGRTIAVMGCGADRTYPPEHEALRKQIEARGAVLSELPLGSPPHGYHFPRRNRIISGLCLGVVVTEAALGSGSLITARLAAEQGREVFALPGFVKAENSRGPNGLIKQGATLVETVHDIIEEILPQLEAPFRDQIAGRASTDGDVRPLLGKEEGLIYQRLSFEPMQIDELIVNTGLPAAAVSTALMSMELRGLVRQLPGQLVIRI